MSFKPLADAFTEIGRAFSYGINHTGGWLTGCFGGCRDWSMPDSWHRGYMRGVLYKSKMKPKQPVSYHERVENGDTNV